MMSTSLFQQIRAHRIPKALAQDPPFLLLVEAFEGRSQAAAESGQQKSTWDKRQRFLDIVNRRIPSSDIASFISTINAANLFFDRIPGIVEEDFVVLAALLQFLKDFHLVSEGAFAFVSQEIQARVKTKSGEFESYLSQWYQKTSEETSI
jgi:hypothetical protein